MQSALQWKTGLPNIESEIVYCLLQCQQLLRPQILGDNESIKAYTSNINPHRKLSVEIMVVNQHLL